MSTVRIYKVAELLNSTSQEVVTLLKRDHGIDVKSASSTIEEVVARQFVERHARQRGITLPPPAQMFLETAVPAKGGAKKAAGARAGATAQAGGPRRRPAAARPHHHAAPGAAARRGACADATRVASPAPPRRGHAPGHLPVEHEAPPAPEPVEAVAAEPEPPPAAVAPPAPEPVVEVAPPAPAAPEPPAIAASATPAAEADSARAEAAEPAPARRNERRPHSIRRPARRRPSSGTGRPHRAADAPAAHRGSGGAADRRPVARRRSTAPDASGPGPAGCAERTGRARACCRAAGRRGWRQRPVGAAPRPARRSGPCAGAASARPAAGPPGVADSRPHDGDGPGRHRAPDLPADRHADPSELPAGRPAGHARPADRAASADPGLPSARRQLPSGWQHAPVRPAPRPRRAGSGRSRRCRPVRRRSRAASRWPRA